MLNEEMIHHIRSLTRLLFVVTDEEDRFITDLHQQMKKHEDRIWVFNAAFGLRKIGDLVQDWSARSHTEDATTANINAALIQIYKDDPKEKEHFYVITDPHRWFRDDHVVRRVENIVHQLHQDLKSVKCLIFVGPRRVIPEPLARYFEIVQDGGPGNEEIRALAETVCRQIPVKVPENPELLFRGMTSYEIEQAITQSVVWTKKDTVNPKRVDPAFVASYKRNGLKKSDLIQIIDTSAISFRSVGGADRFKQWAHLHQACWTEEGRRYKLRPPRGILLMGVYGCGKSLCAKALATEWNLPLVQFEMGRIRSSLVGDSENNLHRALRLVESVAPCVMYLDEAEKELSGSQSSAQSDAGTTSRLLSILSTWTQENKAPVCMVMTANSLKTLPPEMVNRMSSRFFFDVPDEEARIDIIRIHAEAFGQDVSGFNLANLAEQAQQLVGREVEQAVEDSMVRSFNAHKPGLDEEILADELNRKSRIVTTMMDDIKSIIDWVGYDPDKDDGVRAHLAASRRSGSAPNLKVVG
jgi:AAA+ superfamily predicted ATPase